MQENPVPDDQAEVEAPPQAVSQAASEIDEYVSYNEYCRSRVLGMTGNTRPGVPLPGKIGKYGHRRY